MVKRIKIGLTMVFNNANTNTRIIALQNPEIETPGIILDNSITIIAEPKNRIIVLMDLNKRLSSEEKSIKVSSKHDFCQTSIVRIYKAIANSC